MIDRATTIRGLLIDLIELTHMPSEYSKREQLHERTVFAGYLEVVNATVTELTKEGGI